MMCVKALLELQPLDMAEARRLVDQLKATPQSPATAAQLLEDSAKESVAQALAALDDPPVDLEVLVDQGSWYSVITARDANVLWRFVCERSVWRLEAAPTWAPAESFDADLLARHFLGQGLSDGRRTLKALMAITVGDLVANLMALRRSVLEGFREGSWGETRSQLQKQGHQRDFEQ